MTRNHSDTRPQQQRRQKSWKSVSVVFCSTLLAFGLVGCAAAPQMPVPAQISKPRYNGAGAEYRLVPGDKIKLTVFGEPDLSGDFGVDGAGLIALPLVGPMRAEGLTLEQFQRAARGKFANGYLKNPRISAEITSFRPVFVHGEVRSGGEFSYREGLRFRDAIAMAGGYTYRAEPSYILLTRDGGPEMRLALPARSRVRPGDNIRVPERFF